MKVVLFCGGLGTRLRDYAQTVPKPLVPIGERPVMWHLMKYYAHFGHKEFILCLGYKSDMIKDYFTNYDECVSNDFVMSKGGKVELLSSDIQDWKITFVNTGLNSNIGQRLMAVRKHIGDDEMFMANYSDSLSDLNLDDYIQRFNDSQHTACFLTVPLQQSFHSVKLGANHVIQDIQPIKELDIFINGGYFIFRRDIFEHMQEGEELVEKPFQRLLSNNKLLTYQYNGFWKAMDTFKDKVEYDRMASNGDTPWQLWKKEDE